MRVSCRIQVPFLSVGFQTATVNPPVTSGGGVLGVPLGKEFAEAPMGGWDTVQGFIDDVKLRGYPSKVLSPSISSWNKSNPAFRRARIRQLTKVSTLY